MLRILFTILSFAAIGISSKAQISIGDNFRGGIVFYIDGTGKAGFVAADIDQSPAVWESTCSPFNGALGFAVGTCNHLSGSWNCGSCL